jgi:DNA-binding LytR/AlgR family response regulator
MHLTFVYLQDKKNRLIFIFKSCIIKPQQRKGAIVLKVTITEDPNIQETEISIVCSKMTNEINDIVSKISAIEMTVAGKKDEEIFLIPVKDIFYFESVDGSVFFYTENEIYEAMGKLYKIEESLTNLQFSRISKTIIANLDKMLSIKKAKNSRLVATLVNQEKIVVSRQFVPKIKKKLGV